MLVLAVSLASFLASVHVVLEQEGWPLNHERLFFAHLIHVWSDAFSHGDLIPLWSERDFGGAGSPMPLFYHKLQGTLGGLFHLVTGSVKSSLILSLGVFSILGSLGVYTCMRLLGNGWVPSLLLAIALPHLNYARTDWLIRGAMPEYSAMMLLPWIFAWLFELHIRGRFALSIGPLMVLLFLAHNAMAFYCAFYLAIGVAVYLVFRPARWRTVVRRGAVAFAAFLALCAPFLALLYRYRGDFNIDSLTDIYHPTRHFVPISGFFYDGAYSWGLLTGMAGQQTDMTFQMDVIVLLGALVALGILAFRFRGVWLQQPMERRFIASLSCALFLGCGFTLLLQLPLASRFYQLFPGAAYIQFPWRLSGFLAVLLLLLFGTLTTMLARVDRRVAEVLVAVVCVATVSINVARPVLYGHLFFAPASVENPYVRDDLIHDYVGMLPVLRGAGGERLDAPGDLERLRVQLRRWQSSVSFLDGVSCTTVVGPRTVGYKEVRYDFECVRGAVAALPLVWTELHQVSLEQGGRVQGAAPRRTDEDPRVRLEVPAGKSSVLIRMPTLWRMLGADKPNPVSR